MNLAINLLLALIWVAATGSFTFPNLLAGAALGFFAMRLVHPVVVETGYFRAVGRTAVLALVFLGELVASNLRMARDVLGPRRRLSPGIVAIPLDLESELGITTLANMLTLTPGTLAVELSPDCETLYLHTMAADDPDEVRRHVKNKIERRLLEVMR